METEPTNAELIEKVWGDIAELKQTHYELGQRFFCDPETSAKKLQESYNLDKSILKNMSMLQKRLLQG